MGTYEADSRAGALLAMIKATGSLPYIVADMKAAAAWGGEIGVAALCALAQGGVDGCLDECIRWLLENQDAAPSGLRVEAVG